LLEREGEPAHSASGNGDPAMTAGI
jgi:hypothetical protein